MGLTIRLESPLGRDIIGRGAASDPLGALR